MDAEHHARLLAFATGSTRVPLQGWAALNFVITFDEEPAHLPSAHTCYQNLVLPMCRDRESFREKLDVIVHNDLVFGFGIV